MKKSFSWKKTLLKGFFVLLAIIISGQLGSGEFFGAKIAFGYGANGVPGGSGGAGGGGGFGIPEPLTTNNSTMTVGVNQPGSLNQTFGDGSEVKVAVPAGSVSGSTSFQVTQGQMTEANTPANTTGAIMVGGQIFNINAIDSNNNGVRDFSQSLTITITMPNLPADTTDLGVYYFNDLAGQWQLVPGATFDPASGKVTFTVNHLTKFAVLKVTGTPITVAAAPIVPGKVLGVSTMDGTQTIANGSLIRGTNHKIYVVSGSNKVHIRSLAELVKKYRGKKIISVTDEILATYAEKVNGVIKYANGTLLRGADKKIYVVQNGVKIHIKNLTELAQYKSSKMHQVSNAVLAQY